jgi:hypothetical protein
MSYRLCWLLASSIRIQLASCQRNLYDIYLLLCVQCSTPHDGQRKCPKHVALYSKNKSEKLVHLIGFIIRLYHDARSSQCLIYEKVWFSPSCWKLQQEFKVVLRTTSMEGWRYGSNASSPRFYTEESNQLAVFPLRRVQKAGRVPQLVWTFTKWEKSFLLPGIDPHFLGLLAPILVTTLNELCWHPVPLKS